MFLLVEKQVLSLHFVECLTIRESLVTIDPLWQPANQITMIF